MYRGHCIGTITYMLHWNPVSTYCRCRTHPQCSINGDILKVKEEELMEWLVQASRCTTAEKHRELRPCSCYGVNASD